MSVLCRTGRRAAGEDKSGSRARQDAVVIFYTEGVRARVCSALGLRESVAVCKQCAPTRVTDVIDVLELRGGSVLKMAA